MCSIYEQQHAVLPKPADSQILQQNPPPWAPHVQRNSRQMQGGTGPPGKGVPAALHGGQLLQQGRQRGIGGRNVGHIALQGALLQGNQNT